MKCLVIGAGWYGCHLALWLLKRGHDITIVDKENGFFGGSSSKNQNRLHLGYHYPRSKDTIKECQEGYVRFQQEYPDLSTELHDNMYFISDDRSKTSVDKFMSVFEDLSISADTLPVDIRSVSDKYFRVKERYIDFQKAGEYFTQRLISHLVHIHEANVFDSIDSISSYLNTDFDVILNCTYNRLEPFGNGTFETFTTLLYTIDTPSPFAYTIMDGEYYSIFPYRIQEKLYTVTSVKYGPNITNVDTLRQIVDDDLQSIIPSWKDISTFSGSYVSHKTKPESTTDDRSVRINTNGKIISIYGGKITGIFHAEDVVSSILGIRV